MKHIKNFQKFKTNETIDMMFMPVDPIRGSLDVYKDLANFLGGKFTEFKNKLEDAVDSVVDELAEKKDMVIQNVERYFAKPIEEIDYETVVEKLKTQKEANKLASSEVSEEFVWMPKDENGKPKEWTNEDSTLASNCLQLIFGLNILSLGKLLTFLLYLWKLPVFGTGTSIIISIIGLIVVQIIRKLMKV